MSSKRVGWGIVGLGRIAPRIAASCTEAPHAELVAVCSRDQAKAKTFAEQHGAKRGYDSYATMLADPDVEAVFVCTPNALHAPQTLAAAAAGKHVLCEKPMALSSDECLEMIRACSKADVRLGVGFHLRQHEAHKTMRQSVIDGALGDVLLARAHFFVGTQYDRGGWKSDVAAAGGGAFMSAGMHSLDTLRFVLDSEVREVAAFADALPIEEVLSCVLRFDNGAIAYTDTSRVIPHAHSRNDLLVHGTRASYVGVGTLGGGPTGRLEISTEAGTSEREISGPDLYMSEIDEFSLGVRGEAQLSASGIDGLRAVEFAESMYRAAGTLQGMEVVRHEVP